MLLIRLSRSVGPTGKTTVFTPVLLLHIIILLLIIIILLLIYYSSRSILLTTRQPLNEFGSNFGYMLDTHKGTYHIKHLAIMQLICILMRFFVFQTFYDSSPTRRDIELIFTIHNLDQII